MNNQVIRRRLIKLDEYLAILNHLRRYSPDEFVRDPEHYGSAERFLQLAIEAICDMGNHVIAELSLGVVNSYSDIPAILAEKGYIDASLRTAWVRMIGFRNILVHEYLDIDHDIVYDILQHRLVDIEALKQVFAQFM